MRELGARLRALEARGVHWEWVNEHALARARAEDGALVVGAQRARALLVSGAQAVALESAERLATLADEGIAVHVAGEAPTRARGLADTERADARVRAAFERIRAHASGEPGGALEFASESVRTLRRRLANGDLLVFVHSTGDAPQRVAFATTETAARAVWLDAWDGSARLAERDANGALPLALPAFGSRILLLQRGESPALDAAPALAERVVSERALEQWALAIAGTALDGSSLRALFDWRDEAATASLATPGVYSATVALEPASGHRFVLDLGRVGGAAEVRVNGGEALHALVYPFAVDVTSALRAGENTLEVRVIPPRRNAIAARIEAGDSAYAPARVVGATHRVAAGLLGPVTLRELAVGEEAAPTVAR
jgi:hypothetical protein